MIHSIADCEYPLLCLPGPSIVSKETSISGSFQQNLPSVCNGVSVWKLIMEDVEKEEHSSIVGGIASLYNHSGNQSGGSSENWT